MINFFRNIRKQYADDNRPIKYMRYAIGEIVLVVIGILIALSINTWNENRKDEQTVIIYLKDLKKELTEQVQSLQSVYIDRFDKKIEGLKLARSYYEGSFEITDTLNFLSSITYGAAASLGILRFNHNVFESLKSTGNIGLIESSLRNKIMRHYNYSNLVSTLSKDQSNNYQNLINSFRPFNTNKPGFISKFDQVKMLQALKTDYFIQQTNIELSNTYHNIDRINKLKKSANELIQLINEHLNND